MKCTRLSPFFRGEPGNEARVGDNAKEYAHAYYTVCSQDNTTCTFIFIKSHSSSHCVHNTLGLLKDFLLHEGTERAWWKEVDKTKVYSNECSNLKCRINM